jgi:molybdate transport system substrate-binding protein
MQARFGRRCPSAASRNAVFAALTAALLVTLAPVRAQQATLAVAAASDLQAALPQLAAAFEKESGTRVSLSFGSSGNFFTQIQNGAPFDILMSADVDYPRQLERAGLAESDTLYRYGIGRIVLWTRRDTGIDLREGLSVLGSAKVKRIAIANPDHAPYGRAAVAAMQRANVYDRAKPKLVFGENISQAAQFATSGNAEVGILALSLALAPALKSLGEYIEIPADLHPPIEQAAIVIARSSQKAAARAFLAFLGKPESVQILRSFGFSQ